MSTILLVQGASALPQASTYAAAVDRSFLLAAWFAVFFAVLVAGALALALFGPRFDAGARDAKPRPLARWITAAAAAAAVLFALVVVQGSLVWADVQTAPRGASVVQVRLNDGAYSFTYPNGYVANELHLPLDRPIVLALRGGPAPYTFTVPAFRLQAFAATGQDRQAWVQATQAGEFEARSTTFPRATDAAIAANVIVHEAGGFETWYAGISGPPLDLPPIELGARSYQMRGCTQCHSIDGSKLVGPSFKGFLARQHVLSDQSVVEPTDEYIRESLLDPTAKVVAGFEPVMPSFRGRLHDLEIAGLAAYIKSLQ